jgi:hypothetical protein
MEHAAGSIRELGLEGGWKDIGAYAFPPFCVIQKCLTKILRKQAELTIVTQYWPAQPWFPSL